MDNGILVVESWLKSATEYIAIDNTPFRPGIHVDWRSGLARLNQSAGHAKLKSQQPLFHVFVALEAVARVNWVIPCVLLEYINYVSLA